MRLRNNAVEPGAWGKVSVANGAQMYFSKAVLRSA